MTEAEFISFWEQTDFSSYNEMDVREEFIAPLLALLGYSKNTVNDVIREKTLRLTVPFQRLGRKQVRIDYVPSVRLKSFWILEAKPGSVPEMDSGDLLQAYLYATHPEIQAQYIVLCNGSHLRVYDVHQVSDWNLPFLSVSQGNCREKFAELRDTLSAQTMLASLRKRLLSQIQSAFEVELDVKELEAFSREFQRMRSPLEQRIRENARSLQRKEFARKEQAWKEELQNASPETLLSWMERSGRRSAQLNREYSRRSELASPQERSALLRRLMQIYLGRSQAEFKCDCLAIYLHVVKNRLEVAPSPLSPPPDVSLRHIIRGNLTYHREAPLQNALDFLDRTLRRYAYLFIRTRLTPSLSQAVAEKKAAMSAEDLLVESPSVARDLSTLVELYVEFLWFFLSRGNSPEEIWSHTRVLLAIFPPEKEISLPPYPDRDDDLLWYDSYGDRFDYLFRVTCLLLRDELPLLDTLGLDQELMDILHAGPERCADFLPKLPPLQDPLTKEDLIGAYPALIRAFGEAIQTWDLLRKP